MVTHEATEWPQQAKHQLWKEYKATHKVPSTTECTCLFPACNDGRDDIDLQDLSQETFKLSFELNAMDGWSCIFACRIDRNLKGASR